MKKDMKHTIRFIILFFVLVTAGAGHSWAITTNDIIINVQPQNAGTVQVTNISGLTVTISAVPAAGYTIDAEHIFVEKMVDPMAAMARSTPGLSSGLEVTANGGNSYSFTIPQGYDGAYVTATFYSSAVNSITSLSQITNLAGNYVLTADVNAAGFESLGNFTGTLDGGFHKIYNLSEPLFTSTSGSAVIRNIIFEDVSISISGDAGAITANAGGNTRIYNCGILPTSVERDNNGNITGFSGSTVSGTGNVGGLVGILSDKARVINCYSYATITNGSNVGGIVGYNSVASSQANVATMVMNCMFYGDITGGSTVSPVYGGENINNLNPDGLATYNYYAYTQLKTKAISNDKYNCALAMEERFLNRCEIYRQLLNSNKKLAAIYATGDAANANQMAKWVLETADRQIINPMPYPVLKEQGKYPSIINIDTDHVPDSASVGRNQGGKVDANSGKLAVTIYKKSQKTNGGQSWPEAAASDVQTTSLQLIRTDKDTTRYNFNYDKVQLPYYNDVGTGNYTENRVVTGWKIVAVSGGTQGTFSEADEWGGYNFADRKCTDKDVYSVSGRVFSQGAYYDVPYGVTGITIEPYWGVAAYASDQYYDVVYSETSGKNNNYTSQNVNVSASGLGTQNTNNSNIDIYGDGNTQKVFTSINNARNSMSIPSDGSKTVYDYAVVLVGNVHQSGALYGASNTPYTIMSVDLDKDNEPDYSFIFSHYNRQDVSSIRFDFLNVPGTAQAQKPNGATQLLNVSIFNPKGWFEVTNTCNVFITQFEADNENKTAAPVIFLGGVIDQYTSTKDKNISKNEYNHRTQYIHLGSNACFKEFGNGTHSDGWYFTNHVPVSVTGGDFDGFYLSGVYRPDAQIQADDAEGYISGGRFKEMAGAAQQMIDGNVRFQIYDADITNFYGGGLNAEKPITGNVTVDIFNSHVGTYCGGPKFGDMQKAGTTFTTKYSTNKAGSTTGTKEIPITADGIVTTNATGCTFGKFFGAGYGGASSYKLKYFDNASSNSYNFINSTAGFTSLISNYNNDRGKYYDGNTNTYKTDFGNKGPGVATDFDYEFFVWSSGAVGARFYVNYTTFSLAKTNNVNSYLTKCTITGDFYGGGSLGVVDGNATSSLTDCSVNGSVYGAGFSASIPSISVRATGFAEIPYFNANSGIFEMGKKKGTVSYTWQEGTLPNNNTSALNDDNSKILTNVDLDYLGTVTGNITLNIEGNTTVGESIYGGGEESAVNGTTTVTVNGGSVGVGSTGKFGYRWGNVYGGGKGKITIQNDGSSILDVENKEDLDAGIVKGNTNVTINGTAETTKILHNVYGGGAVGSVGTFTRDANGMPTACAENTGLATVTINGGKIGHDHHDTGMVDGSSRGWEGNPNGEGAFAFLNQLAWVNNTNVIIGDPSSEVEDKGPSIMGSVYGGGENGHNFQNAQVTVHKGTIGFEEGTWDCGNVYGAGCGTDTFSKDDNGNGEIEENENNHHNPMAGLVRGNTTITINGGHVLRSVYGGGSMGSVGTDAVASSGKTTITIKGGKIGTDDTEYGNVFGGPKGNLDDTEVIAHVRETEVTIKDGDINYCVYGGGEAGIVNENTKVKIEGGSVNHSVFGGGCLADVLGNTRVEMTDGYVFNGLFGGGYSGSVGTFTRSTEDDDVTIFGHTPHEGCIGRPMSCAANTGKCTVVITGGQVGPIEVATEGMTRRASENVPYDPVEEGWVWGGSRGLVQDPTVHIDTHFTAYVNETDVTIGGTAFILESIIGGGEFGRVLGDTHVTIQENSQIGVGYQQTEGNKPKRYDDDQFVDPSITPITDANALPECSHFPYGYIDPNGDGKPVYLSFDQYYDKYYDKTTGLYKDNIPAEFALGSTSNASDGKTWIGCVFGGGSGYMPCEREDGTGYGWVPSAGWVGGNTNVTITGGHILTNVYGANEYTNVEGKSTVKMSGGTIGVPRTLAQIQANPLNGNLFGAGKGDPRTHFNKMTNVASTEVEVTGGIIYGSVYGGGEDGHVLGNAVTTIKKGEGDAPVIGCSNTAALNGNVFGGGQGSVTALTAGVIGGNVTLNIEDGTVMGSVYGGGELASVGTHFAMTTEFDYGVMQEEDGHGDIAVNLKGGTIKQNVYGGCMGSTENALLAISKNVTVELNKDVADNARGCAVMGNIFGCNNVNSSPEGTATVHVYKTQRAGKSRITNGGEVTDAKVSGSKDSNGEFILNTFDVQAVYGGGNMAAYVPKTADGSTNVIIDGCDRTSIGHVYGGGNVASTPATNVVVNGTFEIGELFGGGNGKDAIDENTPNPGANVGYKDYHLVENNPEFSTKEARVNGDAFSAYRYGTGEATVNVKGGKIHRVFGGSNTKGNVRKTALTILEEVEEGGNPICSLNIEEAYGGGKSAPMDAEAQLLMACIPGLKEVYGGAQAADVNDNVTLTITNGTFDRVFGGNNISGTIRGSITVNIEETGCKPVIIGELYGGGNLAGYSVYGYNSNGSLIESGTTPLYNDPQVNVKSFTSIGTVYGGGYGEQAVMVGNPTVSINVGMGAYANDDKSVVTTSNNTTPGGYAIPTHEKGKIGAINSVFGGGNAAKVIGNTTVNIGTEADKGADIRGNVYGGGNNAEVTGNTNVQIGKKTE